MGFESFSVSPKGVIPAPQGACTIEVTWRTATGDVLDGVAFVVGDTPVGGTLDDKEVKQRSAKVTLDLRRLGDGPHVVTALGVHGRMALPTFESAPFIVQVTDVGPAAPPPLWFRIGQLAISNSGSDRPTVSCVIEDDAGTPLASTPWTVKASIDDLVVPGVAVTGATIRFTPDQPLKPGRRWLTLAVAPDPARGHEIRFRIRLLVDFLPPLIEADITPVYTTNRAPALVIRARDATSGLDVSSLQLTIGDQLVSAVVEQVDPPLPSPPPPVVQPEVRCSSDARTLADLKSELAKLPANPEIARRLTGLVASIEQSLALASWVHARARIGALIAELVERGLGGRADRIGLPPVATDHVICGAVNVLLTLSAAGPLPTAQRPQGAATLADLRAAVDRLAGAGTAAPALREGLSKVASALERRSPAMARLRLGDFVGTVIDLSNRVPGGLAPDVANELLAGAANVLIGIRVSGTGSDTIPVPPALSTQVASLTTSRETIKALTGALADTQATLAASRNAIARARLADFVADVIERRDRPAHDPHAISTPAAAGLIDAALRFLASVPLTGAALSEFVWPQSAGSLEELVFVAAGVATTDKTRRDLLDLLQKAGGSHGDQSARLAKFVALVVDRSNDALTGQAGSIDLADAESLLGGVANLLIGRVPWFTLRVRPAQPLVDGAYRFGVTVADNNGNRSAHLEHPVWVDNVAPQIVSTVPAAARIVPAASPIEVRFAPDVSGVSSFTLGLDGADLSQRATLAGDRVAVTPSSPLLDGEHAVTWSLTDRAGNRSAGRFVFVADAVPPAITELRPAPDLRTNAATALISARYVDARAGIDPASVRVLLDGADATSRAAVGLDGLSIAWPAPAEGTHTVTVGCADLVGNRSEATWTFVVDRTPARVAIDPALDHVATTDTELLVHGTVSEPATVDVGNVHAAVAADLSWQARVPLARGFNRIEARAVDRAGNASVSDPVEVYSVAADDTAATGFVLDADGKPVSGATVTARPASTTGVTNHQGRFVLPHLPAGDLWLDVDPIPAGLTGHEPARLRLRAAYGAVAQPRTPIWLLRSAMERAVTIPEGAGATTVAATGTPDMTITVSNAGVQFPDGKPRAIAVQAVPSDRLPVDLPEFVPAQTVAVLEPSGTTFPRDQRAQVTLPNQTGHEAGTIVPLVLFNTALGSWELGGFGRVSDDARHLESLPGLGLQHFSIVAAAPLGPRIEALQEDHQVPGADALKGALELSVELPSFRVNDTVHTPALVYSSLAAAPALVITGLFKGMKEFQNPTEIVQDETLPIDLEGRHEQATLNVTAWRKNSLSSGGMTQVGAGTQFADAYIPSGSGGAPSPFASIPSGYWQDGNWIEVATSVVSQPVTFFKASVHTTIQRQNGAWPEAITSRYFFADVDTGEFTLQGPMLKRGPAPPPGAADGREEFPSLPASLALTYHLAPRLADGTCYPTGLYSFLARYRVTGRAYQMVQYARVAEVALFDSGWHDWISQQAANSGSVALRNLLGQVDAVRRLANTGGELSVEYRYSDPLDYLFHNDAGRVVVHNLSDSAFGRGWSLKEVQQLYPLGHTHVLVTGPEGRQVFTVEQTIQAVGSGAFGAMALSADANSVIGGSVDSAGEPTGTVSGPSLAVRTLPRVIRTDQYVDRQRQWIVRDVIQSVCVWVDCSHRECLFSFFGVEIFCWTVDCSRPDCHDQVVGVTGSWSSWTTTGTRQAETRVDPEIAGLAVAADGTVFVADRATHRIFRIGPGGQPEVIAGRVKPSSGQSGSFTSQQPTVESWTDDAWSGEEIDPGFTTDQTPFAGCQLDTPSGLALDASGNLLFAERGTHRVRRLDFSTGLLETVAGTGSAAYDPTVTRGSDVSLPSPQSIAVTADGDLYVLCNLSGVDQAIGVIDRAGFYRHVVGNPGGTVNTGVDGRLYRLIGARHIAVDRAGNLFISATDQNIVLVVGPDGFVDALAGSGDASPVTGDGGQALNASLARPQGIAVTPEGNLVVADTGHSSVRLISRAVGVLGRTELAGPTGYFDSRLRREPDGTWIRLYKNGSVAHFDALGLHRSTLDRNQNETRYSYDDQGRVTAADYPRGASLRITYSADGLASAITDHGGRVTTLGGHGPDLATIALPDGASHTFTCDAAGRITSRVDPIGVASSFTYNEYGRVVTETTAGQSATVTRPDDTAAGNAAGGAPITATTAHTEIGHGSKDGVQVLVENGQPTQVVTQDGASVSVQYAGNGLPAAVVRPNDQPVVMTYNATGDATAVHDHAIDASEQYEYGENGLKQRYVDPVGRVTRWTYDAAGNVTSEQHDARVVESTAYGPSGEVRSRVKRGVTTTFTYDDHLNVQSEQAGDLTTRYERDALGNPIAKTVGARRTAFQYDAMNRLTRVEEPRGHTAYEYDRAGGLVGMTDPAGQVERYTYDERGKLTERVDALGQRWSATYDTAGWQLTETAPDGTLILVDYSLKGRYVRKTSGSVTIAEERRREGELVRSVSEPVEVRHSYDAAGRHVKQEVRFKGRDPIALSFELDASGKRTAILSPGATVRYTYDDSGDLASIRCGELDVTIERDAGGQIARITRGNRVQTGLTYDGAGRIASLADTGAPGLLSRALSYDATGDCVGASDARGRWTYSYDGDGQLVHATRDGATPVDEQFTYDARGNRASGPGGPCRYDAQGVLLLEDGSWTYRYDGRGNLVEKTSKIAPQDRHVFEYSPFNQLTAFRIEDGGATPRVAARYWFDGSGLRVGKQVVWRDEPARNETRRWIYDGDDLFLELDGDGKPVRQYVGAGTADSLVGFLDGGSAYYYLKSQLGSVEQVLDAVGAITASYDYTPFGQPLAATGSPANAVRYTGRLWDEESGTYHYRTRQYDPASGRFLQQDTAAGDHAEPISIFNRYVYVRGNPVQLVDPFGRFWRELFHFVWTAIKVIALVIVAIVLVVVAVVACVSLIGAIVSGSIVAALGFAATLALAVFLLVKVVGAIAKLLGWGSVKLPSGRIKHIFVLMLENRSFDHMLGRANLVGLDAVFQKPRPIDGVTFDDAPGLDRLPGLQQPIATGATLWGPFDPGHEFEDVMCQLCGPGHGLDPGGRYPTLNQLPQPDTSAWPQPPLGSPRLPDDVVCDAYLNTNGYGGGFPLTGFTPDQVPVITALAREFAVCDRWFCSVPGPTWPNRFFVHCASSSGLYRSPSTDLFDTIWKYVVNGYHFDNGTIYDKIEDEDFEWVIYEGDELPQSFAIAGMDWAALDGGRFRGFSDDFFEDVNDPDYPYAYAFIEPNWGRVIAKPADYAGGNSQHPIDDVTQGELLIKTVYETVRKSPHWDSSLIVIMYDEHGGFYDHVPPPGTVPPGDSNRYGDPAFDFGQLGSRVPVVLISPYIPRGIVDHRQYDHSSLLRTVEDMYGLSRLTNRDANANSFDSVLSLAQPRDCPLELPGPADSSNDPYRK